MPNSDVQSRNKFFTSIWIVFLLLLIVYSIYILITAPELTLNLKPLTDDIVPYVSFRIIVGLYFFIALFNLKKIKNNKLWFGTIIGVGLLSRLILIPSQPVLEDDYYRYLWDGAVTAHGYNPYIYSPLEIMRAVDDVPDELHQLAKDSGELIKNINHPHIRTIYPILSQAVFAVAYFINEWQYWSWKILLLLFDLLLLFVLIMILKHLKLPTIFVAFYWLNPIVIHEIFNGAHMDLLALLPVMLALYFHLKNKLWYSLIALAIAAGFKLWPVVLLPLLLRNTLPDWKQTAKYTVVFALMGLILLLPVLFSNLDESLGFIKYAGKWVNNAAFYSIFKLLIQNVIYFFEFNISCLSCVTRWGIVILYIILVVLILKKKPSDQTQFLSKALLIVAVLYLVSPTQFPWYYSWMVPLLAIRPMVSLLLYPLLLPLYQINYLSEITIYIQHLPVIILFILELHGNIWKNKFLVQDNEVMETNLL
ncbi:MAG: DUF2029 domain-containing protein [Ignavibacteria bacterium]|nr:DUF2029 domain-containing protein [Ignavibacteria bacterium]